AERPGVEVRGIELRPEAAARARLVLDDAVAMPGGAELPASWPAPDCVIFADVLEHMVDPWDVLRQWRSRIREDGCIVVSLPNVAFSGILWGLVRGRWDYTDEGILDRTHLRFFTRRTMLEMVTGAGFRVEAMTRTTAGKTRTLSDRLLRPWLRRGLKLERQGRAVSPWMLWILDSYSHQFLLRARPSGTPSEPVAAPGRTE
ncbi:MAG: methyltransferase domain-containing protein, partial [Anaeromyxobacteraceae bacterium]